MRPSQMQLQLGRPLDILYHTEYLGYELFV